MKKFISIILVLFLVIGTLAGCGPKEEAVSQNGNDENNGDKPEKLVIWEDTDKGIGLEPAIKSFEEKYGIKVEYRELGMADEIRD